MRSFKRGLSVDSTEALELKAKLCLFRKYFRREISLKTTIWKYPILIQELQSSGTICTYAAYTEH